LPICNAAASPAVTVALSGTGVAVQTGPRTVVLAVDDGSFESGVGQPSGLPSVSFVNRLTPSSYPAKLTKIQVHFGNAADELPAGHPVSLIWASNPGAQRPSTA
jgi:hypothetical protein